MNKLKQRKRQRADIKRGLKTKSREHKRITTKISLTKKKGKGWVELYGKKPDMVK